MREYVPYRMLEVEVAANAVYWWAAERILERRLPGERPADPAEYAAAVRLEAQTLRHRFHDKLMRAFLGPEVFEGTVAVAPQTHAGERAAPPQLRALRAVHWSAPRCSSLGAPKRRFRRFARFAPHSGR